jgi:formiminoglutamate deiminase
LLPAGWARDVRVSIAGDGQIAQVQCGVDAIGARHALGIPGLANAHSHAFQRAMAGLAEHSPAGAADSFWGWRETMYRFVERLEPRHVEAIATLAYTQMLESGFTRVAEFHYLHHDPRGRRYADAGEMCAALIAAAHASGIGLTLLPVHYQFADFGALAPLPAQRRFVTDPDAYAALRERAAALAEACPGALVGSALHSLRAIAPAGMRQVLDGAGAGPVHIHVAEQTREVDACLAWSGARPVQWLLDNAPVDARWCLVHATHMDEAECRALARSGAVAGLCPITEANLGDGVFPAVAYAAEGGRLAVGTDSNVHISAAQELALLEYGQRLTLRRRNCLGGASGSPARGLLALALCGGAQACGIAGGRIEAGARADLVALDAAHPSLCAQQQDGWLDGWIFAAGDAAVSAVWVGGQQVVHGGRHPRAVRARERYRDCLRSLQA